MTLDASNESALAVHVAKLMENLRAAGFMLEKQVDGRFSGSKAACRAVYFFIRQVGGGAELAAPFHHIAEAFESLEQGGTPSLFSKKTAPKRERSRSPERKHIQRLAAACLEAKYKLGDDLEASAAIVARAVNGWTGMELQYVTESTVKAWRKQLTADRDKRFEALVEVTLADQTPRQKIENLLKNGPPGLWQS